MKGKKVCEEQNFLTSIFETSQTQRNQQLDEFQEISDKNNSFIKNKLISSLQYFFKALVQFTAQEVSEIIESLIERRKKDLFCHKYEEIFENRKEEYSCLIYFKVQSELEKFPNPIANQLMKHVSAFYKQLIRNYQITTFQFFRFVLLKSCDKIKPSSVQKVIKTDLSPRSESKLVKVNKIMMDLYSGMDLSTFYLLQDEQFRPDNLFKSLKESQQKRNEKILKNIVQFSTKMKKKLAVCNRYRIFTQIEQPKSRLNNFRIRISDNRSTQKQNIYQEKADSKKESLKSGIIIKPFRQKLKLKL